MHPIYGRFSLFCCFIILQDCSICKPIKQSMSLLIAFISLFVFTKSSATQTYNINNVTAISGGGGGGGQGETWATLSVKWRCLK